MKHWDCIPSYKEAYTELMSRALEYNGASSRMEFGQEPIPCGRFFVSIGIYPRITLYAPGNGVETFTEVRATEFEYPPPTVRELP